MSNTLKRALNGGDLSKGELLELIVGCVIDEILSESETVKENVKLLENHLAIVNNALVHKEPCQ